MIYVVSGPPGAGKTSLCEALLASSEFGLHIPVDDLRAWVRSGMSDSVPWTEETERQFQIAEKAACAVARTYATAGFTVTIDHCRNPKRLEALTNEEFAEFKTVKILLLPNLQENLARNLARLNKPFAPEILSDTIRATNDGNRKDVPEGWLVIDNSELTIDETVKLVTSKSQPL